MGRRKPKPTLNAAVITGGQFTTLRADPRFVHVLNLMRAVNSIRFVTDAILTNARGNSTRSRRARFSGGLMLAAATHEAIFSVGNPSTQSALGGERAFAKLDDWRVHDLTRHMARPQGFLDRIRDHTAFHFIPQQLGKWARKYEPDDVEVMAVYGDERSTGPLFMLADIIASLEVSVGDSPSEELEVSFRRAFPFVSGLEIPQQAGRPTVQNYMRCINATMLLSISFCILVEKLAVRLGDEWGWQRALLRSDDQVSPSSDGRPS